MKSVYVIGPKEGPFKVGIAIDPKRRINELQTGNPERLLLLFEQQHDEAQFVETTIHRALKHKRLVGEWFEDDLENIVDAIINYKKFLEPPPKKEPEPPRKPMSAATFKMAVLELQERGIIVAGHGWKTSLANKLGVTRTTIDNFERDGTKQVQTDYAISALIAGLSPYPS